MIDVRSSQGELSDHNASLMPVKGGGKEGGLGRRDYDCSTIPVKFWFSSWWASDIK